MTQVPVAEGLFTWPIPEGTEPQLIGSRCTQCSIVTFPRQASCPRCASDQMAEQLLSRRGRLWAWTTQDFPPPSPPYLGPTGADFIPYGVGYVELPGEVKVESRLTEADPQVLRTGMEMELVVVPFGKNEAGDDVVTFAFQPTDQPALHSAGDSHG